ncbi:MAG: hypothetical protein ABR589_07455 [Chthoniobacterales bacterium]
MGAATGSAAGRILEIGGRKERVVFASPSVRFARGFFSSIKETVSACTRGATGAGGGVAATAAAAVAARDLAAGVAAGLALRAVFAGAAALLVFAAFAREVAGPAAAADLALLLGAVLFRGALFVVVRVGIGFY